MRGKPRAPQVRVVAGGLDLRVRIKYLFLEYNFRFVKREGTLGVNIVPQKVQLCKRFVWLEAYAWIECIQPCDSASAP